jgi:hypothetical protein
MPPILPAIITVLIGNFLIGLLFKPALEQLQGIRQELLSVEIPADDVYTRSFRAKPWNAARQAEEDETARRAINGIFRKYALAYPSFLRIGFLFLIALLLLVNVTIVAAAASFTFWWKVALCSLGSAIVLWLAKWLAADAYPSPSQLHSLDYLASHFSNFHPDSLIRLLNVGTQRIATENRSQLILSCGVHLTGYKFFLVMTNEDESRHHFVAFGKVGAKTRVEQVIRPEIYRWHVPVGDLDPQWPEGLIVPVWVHLFVFISTPVGWKELGTHPHFVSHELWTPHPGDPALKGETMGLTICNPRSQDRQVTFQRKKSKFRETWEIPSINVDADKNHFQLRKLLRYYRRELENATDITSLSGARLPPNLG